MQLTITDIINKCKDMISIADNPPLFAYRVHHYIKKSVSFHKAKRWANRNKRYYSQKEIDVLWFETYDGSGQLCHPDVIFWDNQYWMIATPYPYGMEEYENPSLFCGDSIKEMLPARGNPIVLPSKKGYGSHLSDPCLFDNGDVLYCFYRDTINYGDKIENRISYKIMDKSKVLIKENIVLSSFNDGLLSPAVIRYGKEILLFYVSYIQTNLVVRKATLSEDMVVLSDTKINIIQNEQDWDVWHLDIKLTLDKVQGLFLLRSKKDKKKFKLKKGVFDSRKQSFVLEKDIELPYEIKDVMEHPYKSCMFPNETDKILLSFRDVNSVYVMKIIEIGEKNE